MLDLYDFKIRENEIDINDLKLNPPTAPPNLPTNMKVMIYNLKLESTFKLTQKFNYKRVESFFRSQKSNHTKLILETSDYSVSYVEGLARKFSSIFQYIDEIHIYPLYHLYRIAIRERGKYWDYYRHFEYNSKISKHFIFMNRSSNISREKILKKMLRNTRVKDTSYISWLDRYNKKPHIPKLFLDSHNADNEQHFYPKEYTDALIDIFCETNSYYKDFKPPIITEKTWRPLVCGRLFLGFGAPGYNEFLQKLGFQLYDELFSYNFDKDYSTNKRIRLFYKNIKKLSKDLTVEDFPYVISSLKEKINHNKKLAHKLTVDSLRKEIVLTKSKLS